MKKKTRLDSKWAAYGIETEVPGRDKVATDVHVLSSKGGFPERPRGLGCQFRPLVPRRRVAQRAVLGQIVQSCHSIL